VEKNMDDGCERMDRLISYRSGLQRKSIVNDGDLQIEVATDYECLRSQNQVTLKKIFNHYKAKEQKLPPPSSTPLRAKEMGVEEEMKEVEATFQSMMEIRKTIEEAYIDLMRL
jgi:hypothetical protein